MPSHSAGPNILWIVTTQWRAQSLGCADDPDARTPCLDAFAASATHYRQAITPHPFGPFARAALLTGKESPANGVRDYHDPLPRGSRTIAHALAEAGYDTAFFGKWQLAPRDPSAPLVGEIHARQTVDPEDRGGFAHWEGFEGGFLLNDPWIQGPGPMPSYQLHGYQSDLLVRTALSWLCRAERSERPWFAVLSLESPHPPYAAPAAGVSPPAPSTLHLRPNVPLGGPLEEQARRELSGYHAHIEATDRALGKLLQQDALTDAILAFTSVHGDMHGSHGRFRKGWPHEESIRVPLIVRHPETDGVPAGPSDALLTLLDLHAWTRHWAGLSPRPSPRPFQECSMPCVVALPHQCDRLWTARRSAHTKEVFLSDGSPWLRFDLEQDPWELNNLAEDGK